MLDNSPDITPSDFSALFTRYKDSFVLIAAGYTRDKDVAEDIVNDCFMALWENRANIGDTTNLPAYLMTSVRNRCLNWIKRQKVHSRIRQQIYMDQQRTFAVNLRSLELCDPKVLFESEIADIINDRVESMPDLTRKIFIASKHSGKSNREIAGEFNKTVASIEYEMHKAYKLLKKALEDYLPVVLFVLMTVN